MFQIGLNHEEIWSFEAQDQETTKCGKSRASQNFRQIVNGQQVNPVKQKSIFLL